MKKKYYLCDINNKITRINEYEKDPFIGITGGRYRLIKDDAVNMRYSQEITAGKTEAGIFQGPQNIIVGEKYVGSIYAKGKGELIVGLRNTKGEFVARRSLGKVSKEWKKYEFTLEPHTSCDGDFAIAVMNGTVQVDMATMSSSPSQPSPQGS